MLDTVLLLDDKLSLAVDEDIGQCQESAEVLLRAHENFTLDVLGFESKVQDLRVVSQKMIEKGHYDHPAIAEQQVLGITQTGRMVDNSL